MGMTSELWEKMKDGKEVHIVGSPEDIAVKDGRQLRWKGTKTRVPAKYIFENEWQLAKEEEKEIETEKWMRIDGKDDFSGFYRASPLDVLRASEVMDRKNFLRWGGTMPDKRYNIWPGEEWCIWVEKGGNWSSYYDPENGFTKQIFASYAEMRVEK